MGLEVYISRCSLRLPFFVTSSRYHRTQINPVIYDHIYTVNDGLVPTHYVSISLCFPIPLPVPAGRCVLPTASSACVYSVCAYDLVSRPSGPLQHGGEGLDDGLEGRPPARVVVPTRRQQRGEVFGPRSVEHRPVVQLAHLPCHVHTQS